MHVFLRVMFYCKMSDYYFGCGYIKVSLVFHRKVLDGSPGGVSINGKEGTSVMMGPENSIKGTDRSLKCWKHT